MSRDLETCVIMPLSYPATRSYAEGVAATRRLDWFTPEQASYVSLSRYSLFLLADDPESLIGSYLIHNFPGRVVGMCASCDSALMARQLSAVRSGKLLHIVVPSEEDAESLKISTEKASCLPVETPEPIPVSLYGVGTEDPNWLRIVSTLTGLRQPLYLLSPEKDLMDALWGFPVTFAEISEDQHDRALFNSFVLIHSDKVSGDRIPQKARAFGAKTITTSELSAKSDPVEYLKGLIEEQESRESVDFIDTVKLQLKDYPEPDVNNLQITENTPPRFRNLLVKFPTRGRPDKFLPLLEQYARGVSGRNDVTFLISVDDDDDSIDLVDFTEACKKNEYSDSHSSVTVIVESGLSENKIAAVNRDMEKAPDFDVVLLASDDMIPQVAGYDDVILQAMERFFPSTDGVLWFNDGYTGKLLNTLCCLGKAYYDRFGYIYHPDYYSLWADNEFMRVANRLGRQAYINWTIIKHEHPANNSEVSSDSLYDMNEKWYKRDEQVFRKRESSGYGGLEQRILLSILIPTLTKRRNLRSALVNKVMEQLKKLQAPELFEFCISEDRGEKPIGQKRNELVEQAKGDYIIFLDDDDDVSDNYAETLIAALADNDADCVTFAGLTIHENGTSKVFVHSLRYSEYSETDRVYIRTPNHINAIRTSIAKQHKFPATSFSEDHDFAQSIKKSGALRSEKFIPFVLYLYRPLAGGASATFGASQQNPNTKPAKGLSSSHPGKGVVTHYTTGPVKRDVDPNVSTRRSAPRTRKTRRA